MAAVLSSRTFSPVFGTDFSLNGSFTISLLMFGLNQFNCCEKNSPCINTVSVNIFVSQVQRFKVDHKMTTYGSK